MSTQTATFNGADTGTPSSNMTSDGHTEYAEMAQHDLKKTKVLDQEYEAMRNGVSNIVKLESSTRVSFIKNLIHMAIFHRKGKAVDGYLENIYKESEEAGTTEGTKATTRTYKEIVNHGVNYARLINAVWLGNEKCELVANKTNRISRAMNTINKNHIPHEQMTPEEIDSLAHKLVEKGGMSQLVKYGKEGNNCVEDENIPDTSADKSLCKKEVLIHGDEQKNLFSMGLEHYKNVVILPTAKFTNHITVDDNDMSLVLIKKNKMGEYNVISQLHDESQVEKIIANEYSNDLLSLPKSMHVISEMLLTQCLPASLQKQYKNLLDQEGKVTDGETKNVVRRLFYKHRSNTFLMSPIRTTSGVVTYAQPFTEVFEDQKMIFEDLQLMTKSRRDLEVNILSPRKFKTYVVSDEHESEKIPAVNGLYSHVLQLKTAEKDKDGKTPTLDIQFAGENLIHESIRQVDVDFDGLDTRLPLWDCTVDASWIDEFNSIFTSKWIKHHAKYITRKSQEKMEFKFGRNDVTVNFFNVDDQYDLTACVNLPEKISTDTAPAYFLSKDFAIAMHGLDELQIIGKVQIRLYHSMIRISYSTAAAKYELCIPTCKSNGSRNDSGFTEYTLITDSSFYEEDDSYLDKEFSERSK